MMIAITTAIFPTGKLRAQHSLSRKFPVSNSYATSHGIGFLPAAKVTAGAVYPRGNAGGHPGSADVRGGVPKRCSSRDAPDPERARLSSCLPVRGFLADSFTIWVGTPPSLCFLEHVFIINDLRKISAQSIPFQVAYIQSIEFIALKYDKTAVFRSFLVKYSKT